MSSAIIARVAAAAPPPLPPLHRRKIVWLRLASLIVALALSCAEPGLTGGTTAALSALVGWAVVSILAVQWSRRVALRRPRSTVVQSIFCADGAGLESLLPQRYGAHADIDGLFALGNLHVVGPSLVDGTVAFSRDRDEPWQYNEPQEYEAEAFRKCPPLLGQARVWYFHDGKRWLVKDGRKCQDSWAARRTPWREL